MRLLIYRVTDSMFCTFYSPPTVKMSIFKICSMRLNVWSGHTIFIAGCTCYGCYNIQTHTSVLLLYCINKERAVKLEELFLIPVQYNFYLFYLFISKILLRSIHNFHLFWVKEGIYDIRFSVVYKQNSSVLMLLKLIDGIYYLLFFALQIINHN